MTYRSKMILSDGFRSNHIIINVLDYVIGDFKGQLDGRPTRCSATRSCLVILIIVGHENTFSFLWFSYRPL